MARGINTVCRPKATKFRYKPEKCVLDDLEDIGREQFFYHYSKSQLPIRKIAAKKIKNAKTEPHIEIGAENYLRPCIPNNVRDFCYSREKYLFLCTTCENRELGEGYLHHRFVVGYIKKENCKDMENRCAVFGETYIIPFDKKLDYEKLGFKRIRPMQRFNSKQTRKLLELIHSHGNIRGSCIEEMIKQEAIARENGMKIPIDEECLEDECTLKNKCLRKALK
jgi:hypothetical protein